VRVTTDSLIALVGAFATVEATIVAGVWMLSSKIGDLRSDISELKAHRDAHADGIAAVTSRVDTLGADFRSLSERVAIVEDRTRG
jgi:uncharacterized small protein (DUF1192 family)